MALTLKDRIRAERVAARRLVTAIVRRAESRALCEHLRAIVGDGETVAAYAPLETEPGFPDFPDALLDRSVRVFLPVARLADDGAPLPLRWAQYRRFGLVAAPFGLLEPGGPSLGPSTLGEMGTIFVPALAVDRQGMRLGRGAGFYDRSLHFRNAGARLIAIVRDEEFVDELPREPHDVPMTHVLTPELGLVRVPIPGS